MDLAQRFKELGISQAQFARDIKATPSLVSAVFKGKTKEIESLAFKKIELREQEKTALAKGSEHASHSVA